MDREAYPLNTHNNRMPRPVYDTKKWKDFALKIAIATRQYKGEQTESDIIKHMTANWNFQEKEDFKAWLKYQKKNKTPKYAKENKRMQKVAYDYGTGQKDEQLKDLKKKLRSRINSAERLLVTMMDEDLLQDPSKGVYISRILQKLKEEVGLLRRPQLMAARHNRVKKIFAKAGLPEIANILDQNIQTIKAANVQPLIKLADTGVSSIMVSLKGEIDEFNYGKHLSTLYQIAESLKNAGRHSEADAVIKVIQKDLGDLDKIHKKLVEVYTSLGSIPTPATAQPQEPEVEPAPRGY